MHINEHEYKQLAALQSSSHFSVMHVTVSVNL